MFFFILGVRDYFIRIGSATSQLVNVVVLFGDNPNESISGRSYRMAKEGRRRWSHLQSILNLFFSIFGQKDHCYKAYLTDVTEARLLVAEHKASFYIREV